MVRSWRTIPSAGACYGNRSDSPWGTPAFYQSSQNSILILGSNIGANGLSRVRIGMSYTLAASYAVGTLFKLTTFLGSFLSAPVPVVYLSNSDDAGLYTTEMLVPPGKAAQDWELNVDNLIVSGLASGTVETDIPYATLSPFFGNTISFVIAEAGEIADDPGPGNRVFKQTAYALLTAY